MKLIINSEDLDIAESLAYAQRSINHWIDEPIWCQGAMIHFPHDTNNEIYVLTSTRRIKQGYSVKIWTEMKP